MQTGKIKWFDAKKGFGFITAEDGKEFFVHCSAVRHGKASELKTGDRVEFEIGQDTRGPRAANVRLMETAAS